jgi:hypothetical protein
MASRAEALNVSLVDTSMAYSGPVGSHLGHNTDFSSAIFPVRAFPSSSARNPQCVFARKRKLSVDDKSRKLIFLVHGYKFWPNQTNLLCGNSVGNCKFIKFLNLCPPYY